MCDVNKYKKIYKDISKLQPDDTMQLILEAGTEDEKNFFEMIGDYLLQQSQIKSIKENVF